MAAWGGAIMEQKEFLRVCSKAMPSTRNNRASQRKRKATLASKKAAKRFKRQFWSAVFQELLPIVPPMGKTPGIAGTAEWAVVCDICVACLKPPKGCMCM
jgi:hypothetical protein